MRNKILFWFLLCFLSVFAQRTPMNVGEIAALKNSVTEKNQSINTLITHFTQTKHLEFLSNDIVSKGEMILKAPDKLLWKYTEPFEYSISFTNNKIYINDQGKKNSMDTGNNKVFSKINHLIASSVSGAVFDDKEFDLLFFKEKNQRIIVLSPKSKDLKGYINQVEMYFTTEATVSEVKLIESSQDYTHIVFKNQRFNEQVDDAIFSF